MGAWWDAATPPEGRGDRRLSRLREAVTGAFAEDSPRFANAFEPSASWDGHRWRWLRWSYGLPAWRADTARETARALALVRAFLPAAPALAAPLLGLAERPEVQLPVLGFAYDHPDAWRLKVYVVFREDAGAAAWGLAARALGFRAPAEPTRSLHMVGVDLAPQRDGVGMLGGRLYERTSKGWRLNRPGAGPLARQALPGALLVRRVGAGLGDAALPAARDAHIPLEQGELPQAILGDIPLLAPALAAGPSRAPWAGPEAAARWLGLPLTAHGPLTVYYVLRAP